MNKLKRDKQEAVIRCLVNGSSVRATERMTDVHRDTILRLLVKVGDNCKRLMDSELRGLQCKHIQMDEIWTLYPRQVKNIVRVLDQT